MPLTLHHGPASPQKLSRFLELWGKPDASRLILVANHLAAETFRSRLLAHLLNPVLLGTPVMTFEDWLFGLLKRTLHRAHRADQLTGRYLTFLLLSQNKTFKTQLPNQNTWVHELHDFIIQLKCCGVEPHEFFKKHQSEIKIPALMELAKTYQHELFNRHHHDQGDLFLTVLKLLHTGKLTDLGGIRELFVTGIYPLHAGHRQILRQLKSAFPDLTIHVFYDEDYQRADDLLNKAYLELGEICDHEEFIAPATPLTRPTVELFFNPFDETQAITQKIKALIAAGTPPQNLAIICDSDQAPSFERCLEMEKIPCRNTFAKSCHDLMPRDWLKNLMQIPEQDLADLARTASPSGFDFIKFTQLIREFSETRAFLKNLFKNLQGICPDEDQDSFFNEEVLNLKSSIQNQGHSLIICDLKTALHLGDRQFFLTGLSVESLSKTRDSLILPLAASLNSDLAELIQSPSYLFRVRLENLTQLISQNKNLHISSSETDSRGNPLTVLPDFLSQPARLQTQIQQVLQGTHEFQKITKNRFSLSEIETYLDCPYRHYASHVLHLGNIPRESITPPDNITGSFVHGVLHQFFTNHQSEYLDCLKTGSLSPQIELALLGTINNESQKIPEFKNHNPQVIANLCHRTQKTLVHFFTDEIKKFQDEKKSTLPHFHEWTVGTPDQKGFHLDVDGETVSITARVDRIDLNHEQHAFSVIDYKTGSKIPTGADIKNGKSLQLPFYTLAVKTLLLKDFEVSSALYYCFGKESKPKGLVIKEGPEDGIFDKRARAHVSAQEWNQIEQNTLNIISDTIRAMRLGRFEPHPIQPTLCNFCDYRRVCNYKKNTDEDEDGQDDA